MIDEFGIISKYFANFSDKIGDDCAILSLEKGLRLAVSVDTLVEGVHFYRAAPPDRVGYRAVVTALSDLAAAGAEPRAITLALTLPAADDTWLRQFARGIGQAAESHGVELVGGDTTRGNLTITVQAMGVVPEHRALTRSGARPGDRVCVSGPTGDAAAALAAMDGRWPGHPRHREYLLNRFYRPSARIELGLRLRDFATSAIDVSDGLLADARHLCGRSGVGIRIEAAEVPLSAALNSISDERQARIWALTGGDDYELLFTVSPDDMNRVPAHCTCIGEVTEGSGVDCDFETDDLDPGYVHFGRQPVGLGGS